MADPRFYQANGPFSVDFLARHVGAECAGCPAPQRAIADVRSLEVAEAEHLSFFANRRYAEVFRTSRAGAVIVASNAAAAAPPDMALLVVDDPYLAWAKAVQLFYPPRPYAPFISPSAVVDPTAGLAEGVTIEALAVIGAGASIGAGTRIGSGTVVGPGVAIGMAGNIGPNVTLSHCLIGDRVLIHPGVRIGQDGFGFATGQVEAGPSENGDSGSRASVFGHLKIPQLGRVLIGHDVEIGANTTIDRGAGPDTVIGDGCMIDNLVQIGHNVVIGRGCVLVAQSGIAGSTKLGDFVSVGGQAGIIGHLSIGSGAKIGGQSGITRHVLAGEAMGGSPAVTMRQWLRQVALLAKLIQKKA